MIDVCGASISIGKRTIVAGIDARFQRGAFSAILGANGAGKTTLLRAIAGLVPVAGGAIRIDGRDVGALSANHRALLVALVSADEPALDGVTVRDVVATGRYPHHRWWEWNERPDDADAIVRALRDVALLDFADRAIQTLSSGERQRAWIALGLAQRSPLLLLDEPTSHLDVRAAHDVLRLLRTACARGTTVVCVLHDVNEAAAFADDVMLLHHGSAIATGPTGSVLTSANLERTYGIAMDRFTLPDGSVRLTVRDDR